MLNVTKVTNKDDIFLINYYTDNQKMVIVEGATIAAEMNKAFADIQKYQDDMRVKMGQEPALSLAGAQSGIVDSRIN